MNIRVFSAAFAAGVFLFSQLALANGSIAQVISSAVGRRVLTQTEAGREITRRLLGRELTFGDDLAQFAQRVEAAGERGVELRRRIERIEDLLRTAGRLESLEARETRIMLESFAADELGTRRRLLFSWEFGAERTAGALERAREAFVGAGVPLARQFPQTFWQGTVEERMRRFIETWPDNARLVENVRFELPIGEGYKPTGERNVLVISLQGLSANKQTRIVTEYLDAIGSGTVSFPLTPNGDTLYTRVGTGVAFNAINIGWSPYRVSQKRTLEAVLRVSPEEETRLREYVDRWIEDRARMVGDFEMKGVTSGRTNGSIADNRPSVEGEGHNCTSWMTTAPIGARGEPLLELMGQSAGWNVHTSPGWWVNSVLARAPKDRVPVVVYWENAPLEQILARIRSGEIFNWQFKLP